MANLRGWCCCEQEKSSYHRYITGQDGSYLAELLLAKGYEVHGLLRQVAQENFEHRIWRIRHILDKIALHSGSLESYASLYDVINEIKPDEIYNLGAQTFVNYSFKDEFSTLNININGVSNLLSIIKRVVPNCKFYQASSSEMFGQVEQVPQNEKTPFHPRSPYGISKVAGFDLTRYYREAYNIFACNGILFNHESERRGHQFVTRKISRGAVKIKLGLTDELRLGNLDAKRDWGYAKDYVEAMWLMLQQDIADDYVIATGETHTVREFAEVAFGHLGLDYKKYVKIDEKFCRPCEVNLLLGDPSKANKTLKWLPRVKFRQLVRLMVDDDMEKISKTIEKKT